MEFPNKKYQVIYADPPWQFSSKQSVISNGKINFKSLENQYPSMSTKEIKELPIKTITDEKCALFLWTTDAHLKEAIAIIESWGFEYRTIAFVWVKRERTWSICKNPAPWINKNCEICLLGIKGSPTRKDPKIYQLIDAKRSKHSKKPDATRIRIEKLFGDVPRIELFARQQHQGWDAWGNQLSDTIQQKITA